MTVMKREDSMKPHAPAENDPALRDLVDAYFATRVKLNLRKREQRGCERVRMELRMIAFALHLRWQFGAACWYDGLETGEPVTEYTDANALIDMLKKRAADSVEALAAQGLQMVTPGDEDDDDE